MFIRYVFVGFCIALAGVSVDTAAIAKTTADLGPSALAGIVSSAQEGAMEGVVVSAKKDGSNITVSVISGEQGRYAFPASRLAPGHYTLSIRAAGYDLDGPSDATLKGAATTADIKLKKTANLEAQLTNADWLNSMPGSDEDKRFLRNCTGCHMLSKITNSKYSEKGFVSVLQLMGAMAPGAVPERIQTLLPGPRGNRMPVPPQLMATATKYLASVNLHQGPRSYPLETMPRPTGKDTHVIITTYQLPRADAEPHDANAWPNAPDGRIWYSDFGRQIIGSLDPKTGQVTDYDIPVLKPDEPKGVLDMKLDPEGNIWVGMMYQAGLAKVDRVTKKVTTYPIPTEWQSTSTQNGMVAPSHLDVDGFVWSTNQQFHSFNRYNVRTGKWQDLGILKDQNGETIQVYEIMSDKDNNAYAMDFGGGSTVGGGTKVGRIDAKTGKLTTWKTSFGGSQPRRGHFDDQGRLWFAEFGANGVGMFDPKTEKINEWRLPLKWSMPYDALLSRKGEVWMGGMTNDRVTRLNPKTGEFNNYLLPGSTNIRHVSFDDSKNILWTSGVHTGTVVSVEALD